MPRGVASLTATERRVAALAAAGRAEREIAQELFVTPRIIEIKLGSALRKLGASSQGELAHGARNLKGQSALVRGNVAARSRATPRRRRCAAMTIIDPARDDSLRDLCGGAVALPGDDGYDAARQAFNLARRPAPRRRRLPRRRERGRRDRPRARAPPACASPPRRPATTRARSAT